MHEYSITENLIKIVCQEASKNNGKKVTEINLVIGELASIIDESVQMYFDIISKDTICSGAKLNFKHIKAMLKCKNCNALFEKQSGNFNCPQCNGFGGLTDIGKEFYIESIEVE